MKDKKIGIFLTRHINLNTYELFVSNEKQLHGKKEWLIYKNIYSCDLDIEVNVHAL